MKRYKKVLRNKVDDVLCDACGKSCKKLEDPPCFEYGTLESVWGYFSKKDGDKTSCDLCEDCFDKVLEFVKTIPKE
jgi:hypothetical protein